MEVIIRIAGLFFFIQFVVVMTIMSVALVLARAEVPTLGRGFGHNPLSQGFAFATHLPIRVLRSIVRLLHSMHLRNFR
jgi:hypothetical protein